MSRGRASPNRKGGPAMKVSVVTPTCDRPIPFSLCERWMARQTMQGEWIVADGGVLPARCTMGQIHIHEPRPAGVENFARNLLNGIDRARGDVVVVFEDDDWYSPHHVETLVAALNSSPPALIAGCCPQQYYHIGQRVWRTMPNREHSSLCYTAIRGSAIPIFRTVIERCLSSNSFGIDVALWNAIAREQRVRIEAMTCIGIKGMPGQAGLGMGHRPKAGWTQDPELEQLRQWIGDDALAYEEQGAIAA